MAKPPIRSVNADLKTGIHEGSYSQPGKDWGGPQDSRSARALPDTDNDHEYLLDLPGVNRSTSVLQTLN